MPRKSEVPVRNLEVIQPIVRSLVRILKKFGQIGSAKTVSISPEPSVFLFSKKSTSTAAPMLSKDGRE